jgi:DtxR family Mn-dependent transcriptional regulator
MVRTDRSPERARQDYVKAIFQLGRGSPVSAADLARYLAVSRAAVTKSRRLLEKDGLVRAATSRTDRIELAPVGRELAAKMLRRHRLIETFLYRSLHVPLDDLHRQAEAIEHVISDDVARRLARFLGNPRVDPHGHPISAKNRGMTRSGTVSLADVKTGSRLRIESIPDRDPSIVRRLLAQRVLPGLRARVIGRARGQVRLQSALGKHLVASRLAPMVEVSIATRTEPRR